MKIERKMYNFKDIPLHHPHPPPQKNDRRITIRSSGEKCIERVVTVALPSCQCRVSAHNSLTNTTLPTTQPKMATAIFGFGLAHAPEKPQGLDRKNTIAGKVRGKAGTANNKRFCMIAALPRVDKILVHFRGMARVDSVLEAATTQSRRALVASGGQRNRQKTECQYEQPF